MTIKVQRTGRSDYGKFVSAVIAGPPGKGKTRFSITAEDPFLLNAEAGTMSIASEGIPSTKIEDSETLLKVRSLLAAGPEAIEEELGFPVKTVIIDTFDEVSRIIIRERLEHEQKDVMQAADWSWLNDQLNAIIRGFRSLEMNVIFTCHIKDVQEGDTGKLYSKLDISGAAAHQLPGAVDLCFLLDDRMVPVETDTGDEMQKRTFLFTEPDDRHEWIKDRSGKLPTPKIELNFETDFVDIVELIYKDVDLTDTEVIEITFEPDEAVAEKPEEKAAPVPQEKTPEESAAAIEEAEAVVKEAKRARLTEESDRKAEAKSVDLSDAKNGDRIEYEGNAYELNTQNKLKEVVNTRFVYVVGDEKVLSRNQLQKGVSPIPDPDVNTGVFCQVTGKEIPASDANISRLRYRQVLCEEEFQKKLEQQKASR